MQSIAEISSTHDPHGRCSHCPTDSGGMDGWVGVDFIEEFVSLDSGISLGLTMALHI